MIINAFYLFFLKSKSEYTYEGAKIKLGFIQKLRSIFVHKGKDEEDSTIEYGRLRVWFRDPAAPGNHYRIFLKNQDFTSFPAPFNSVFEDRIINGDSIFFDVSKPDAQPSFLVPDSLSFQERRRFVKGDTIDVRFCSINRESYSFIRSFQSAAASFGNPFAAPTFVKGNMKGALGGFVGYGASYHTFISQ